MFFDIPKEEKSIIKVIGVGGGGSNAVNNMYKQGIVGVDFAVSNTDNQALAQSPVPTKIKLGPQLTEGRGAGSTPQVGKQACLESIEEIRNYLEDGTKMLFVTAGMGGGTGTGAAPIIAKLSRELGILTVGIVTMPFQFEGRKRVSQGEEGLDELRKNVDTLIVISNNKLREIHGNLTLSAAFGNADDILTTAAKSIAEIITVAGLVNVDFADVDTVMRNSGVAIMGTATASGDDRAIRAADEALNSPLLEESNIIGAKQILVNISSGTKEVTMDEVFHITQFIQEEAGDANLIFGTCYDEKLGDALCVTVIATGFESNITGTKQVVTSTSNGPQRIVLDLDDSPQYLGLGDQPKRQLFDNERQNGASAVTFDLSTPNYDTYRQNQYSSQEPFIKNVAKPSVATEDQRRYMMRDATRREQQRPAANKINVPQNLADVENVPAYMRRNVRLDDVQHSSEPMISRWTISEDDAPDIRSNNSFLHDNVD